VSSDEEHARAVDSIRAEYGRRDIAPQCQGVFSFQNPAHAFQVFEREQAIIGSLTRHLAVPLADASVLDVGCGSGLSLAMLAVYGARPDRLHGFDIMESRIDVGRAAFPAFDLRVGDGVDIAYPDDTFDLVQQITVLSSVPDVELSRHLAGEMLRVLKPTGILLSYDVAPAGVLPRAINRALRAFDRRRPNVSVSAKTPNHEPVVLRSPAALDADHVRSIFSATTQLELQHLTLYRPLADRLARHRVILPALGAIPALTTAILYVGRKPPA
jgi:SAM-dependent methyltransferase